MAFVFCDGFDYYSATADLADKGWTNGDVTDNTILTSGGHYGGGVLQCLDDVDVKVPISFSGGSTWRMMFHILVSSSITIGTAYWLRFDDDGGGAISWELRFDSSGRITVTDMDDDSAPFAIIGTTTTDFRDSTWHIVELRVTLGTNGIGNGTLEVWVDGSKEIDSSTATTSRTNNPLTTVTTMKVRSPATSAANTVDFRLDDIIVWDDQAGDVTGALGEQRIYTLTPSAEGNQNDFTPSAGMDNSANVDDSPHDDDTTYNESGTSTNVDLYGYADLPAGVPSVAAVVVNTIAKNPDVGSISFKATIRSGTTEQDGANVALSGSYATYQEAFDEDPDAGPGAWSLTTVNALEAGLEVV